MAQLNKTSFKALYGSSGTTFPDNTTEEISEGDMRQFGEDQADSFMTLSDNFIDEDTFATDSAIKAPSQQSTKAYIASQLPVALFNTDLRFFEQDDFINQYTNTSQSNWVYSPTFVSNNANDGVDNTENAFGVIAILTGIATNGNGTLAKANITQAYMIGSGSSLRLRFRALINTLSNGTETFTVRIGFIDSITGDGTDGLFFRYTHSVNGGRWESVARSGGSETASDTGVAPAAGVYQILDVSVNAAGTQCEFYIDNVLTATIATNVPSGSSNLTNIMAKIEKSAGTTSRYIAIDWYDFLLTRTTPR
jgi:hypothetical protein